MLPFLANKDEYIIYIYGFACTNKLENVSVTKLKLKQTKM